MRQLLNHRAGLCAVDEPLTPRVLSDLDRVAGILARQRPAWDPGTRQGYHYLTLGLCENELLRRVDPRGRSLGRFLREEIMTPLSEEFYVGLPPEVPASGVAKVEAFHPLRMLLHVNTMPLGLVLGYMNPRSVTARTLGNPKLRSPGDLDKPEYRRVELGAAGGIGTARAVAKAYGAFAAGGKDLGVRAETIEELSAPAPPPPRRLARRGPQDRHELLARLLQALARLPLRHRRGGVRDARGRGLLRLRRPHGGGGLRLRAEQDGFPRWGRPP